MKKRQIMTNHFNKTTPNAHSRLVAFMALAIFTLICGLVVFFLPAIPQRLAYHQFADTRQIWGIPNFWNVVSNVPFAVIGLGGFWSLRVKFKSGEFTRWQEGLPFIILFVGIFLVSMGSAYYHWEPDNQRLVWDRMPMAAVFTTLVALVIMERVNFRVGLALLAPFILLGIGSVGYWGFTESLGRGDLRLYGFIQFYSIALLITLFYFFPKPRDTLMIYIAIIGFYGLAKLLEGADFAIYQLGGVVSGHTLKHLAAAISSFYLVILLKKINFKS